VEGEEGRNEEGREGRQEEEKGRGKNECRKEGRTIFELPASRFLARPSPSLSASWRVRPYRTREKQVVQYSVVVVLFARTKQKARKARKAGKKEEMKEKKGRKNSDRAEGSFIPLSRLLLTPPLPSPLHFSSTLLLYKSFFELSLNPAQI
jgi:hypothetical protein